MVVAIHVQARVRHLRALFPHEYVSLNLIGGLPVNGSRPLLVHLHSPERHGNDHLPHEGNIQSAEIEAESAPETHSTTGVSSLRAAEAVVADHDHEQTKQYRRPSPLFARGRLVRARRPMRD
jgi:hypothetical protein